MSTAMRSLGIGLVAMSLTALALAAQDKKDEKNLAVNGGFEEVKDAVPAGWSSVCAEGGTVTHKAVADGAKDGKYCLSMKSKAEWAVAYSTKIKIDRAKTYTLTGFVRVKAGNATIKIDYFNGDEMLGYTESDQSSKDEWTAFKVVSDFESHKEATHVLVAGVIHGDGEALFDKFELTMK